MSLPKRIAVDPVPVAPSLLPDTYRPGGEVGRMQTELAHRLAGARLSAAAGSPGERVVRAASVTGGYGLLFLAYGGAALLFWR